ncbi:hypothetical protein EV694_0115 [Volucribacter psittacicida]|uniref:Uncharacterized protein n=1 Tax=Volucribacter psittacicida TaxID=203482 RepID=A0A4R1GB97_9PAST|nr:hypothetical protein [Volucribacter psittacicida]TCK01502.1 hypothetical protein EV694_0115 [Volucribacter psittacicida]
MIKRIINRIIFSIKDTIILIVCYEFSYWLKLYLDTGNIDQMDFFMSDYNFRRVIMLFTVSFTLMLFGEEIQNQLLYKTQKEKNRDNFGRYNEKYDKKYNRLR